MKYKFTVFSLLCITIIMFTYAVSCVPQACLEDMDANVKASFYVTGTGKLQAPGKVTLYGLGRDTSKIYNEASDLQTIEIPLDAGSDTCRFIMIINGITDTVNFIYSSYPHLVTKECGYTYYHNLELIENTRSDVDFLIKNREITTKNVENIHIFY